MFRSALRLLSNAARRIPGNVGTCAAFGAIPAVIVCGFAVEQVRGRQQLARLQGAADATARALAKLPNTTTAAQLETRGRNLFAAHLGSRAADVKVDVAVAGAAVSVSGHTGLTASMLHFASRDPAPITASSTAAYAKGRLDLAVVMDWGASGKPAALQRALDDFVAGLAALPVAPGAVRLSLQPAGIAAKAGPGAEPVPLTANLDKLREAAARARPAATRPLAAALGAGLAALRNDAGEGGGGDALKVLVLLREPGGPGRMAADAALQQACQAARLGPGAGIAIYVVRGGEAGALGACASRAENDLAMAPAAALAQVLARVSPQGAPL